MADPAAVAAKILEKPKAPAAPVKAPFVEPKAEGFQTWTEFCNALAIQLVVSDFGRHVLNTTGGDLANLKRDAADPISALALKAYRAVRMAHAMGVEKLAE